MYAPVLVALIFSSNFSTTYIYHAAKRRYPEFIDKKQLMQKNPLVPFPYEKLPVLCRFGSEILRPY